MFGKFKKRYILYFSVSSILINTISILQYIGFNPFNMYQNGIGTHNVSFMATIGNISFISAMFCILLTVSFVAYVFLEEKLKYKIIHLLSIFMGFFIFIIINVLSGRVAFLAVFALLIPFIITNSKRLSRTIIAMSMILLGLLVNIIINPQYHYDLGRLDLYFQFNKIALMFIIVIFVFWILAYILKRMEFDYSRNNKITYGIYIAMISIVVLILGCVYFINFESGILYEVHELLHGNFDDDFGTYRVFLWKRTLKLFPENPILGTGPDTFAVRFMDKYTQDVMDIGELSINDSAANVYLTMLINIGIVGLISYLVFIILQLIKGLKNKNEYSIILLISIICYLIQDCFNLWVVIVTPIFWVLMGIHYLSLNNNKMEGITNERRGKE